MIRFRWFVSIGLCMILVWGCSPAANQENPAGQETTGGQEGTTSDASAQEQVANADNETAEGSSNVPESPTSQSDPAVQSIQDFITQSKIDTTANNWRLTVPKPTQATFTDGKTYYWVLQTNKGTMKIALMPSVAPMHVTSTIYLTLLGFYDTLTFHRVITGFMAQGGDPLGNGRGGPGYKYAGEFSAKVTHNKAGLLSMANAGPNTDGSQFFITFVPTPHLDGKHTIFGEVKEGTETLKALEAAGSRSGTPTEKLVIEKATIVVE